MKKEKILGYMAYSDVEDKHNSPAILSQTDLVPIYDLYESITDVKKDYNMKIVKIVEVLE